MELFPLISLLIVLSACFAYVNFRYLKLPKTIGLMFVSLLFSLGIIAVSNFFPSLKTNVKLLLSGIHFSELLLEVMLSFMLFAGAIHIKFKDLKAEKLSILLFSTISVVISTILVGYTSFYILNLFHFNVTLLQCFLFGSLISPTDPIAVFSILKTAGVTKSLETKIAGESLFNDGVAVVVFISILQLAKTGDEISITNVLTFFGKEALGGILMGGILGWIAYKIIASIDNYNLEVLITLALVMGGYSLAHYIHVSGPLAMVIAGLITGNHGKRLGMSNITAEYVDKFWELIDEILNALLFVLIGLELLVIKVNNTLFLVSSIIIIAALVIRYVSIFIPSILIRLKEKITRKTILILTWGGLRGGISIALALSIPTELGKDIWVTITYIIVCFSILVQGLTIGKVVNRLKE
ncbi:cation:proton antiporter [Flavobacterium cellulosilyticum]|uniref:Sodium:proton antiporter n=1 Tax=Flavobacterium cellulosilyticum TaxID=2541731 RepID=A0A4V2YZF5_9FLAO|nr:sodium:proton antiporter [Flavobacterium cellulosilyticum]TDD97017.1 sodium:proton antiporter [Flavobacterium cellulosilyticum]